MEYFKYIFRKNKTTILITGAVLFFVLMLFIIRPDSSTLAYAESSITLEPMVTLTNTGAPPNTSTPTQTGTATLTPTETDTATATPYPTQPATPIPATPTSTPLPAFVIWSKIGEGGYFREAPNGRILELIANGTMVKDLSERADADGLTWSYVLLCYRSGCTKGWMAILRFLRIWMTTMGI